MSEELKLCSHCGHEGEIKLYPCNQKWVSCLNPDCSAMLPFESWQRRPIEDALRKQLEEQSHNLDIAIGQNEIIDAQLEAAIGALKSMSNQATCRVYVREKLAEIERIGKEAGDVKPKDD